MRMCDVRLEVGKFRESFFIILQLIAKKFPENDSKFPQATRFIFRMFDNLDFPSLCLPAVVILPYSHLFFFSFCSFQFIHVRSCSFDNWRKKNISATCVTAIVCVAFFFFFLNKINKLLNYSTITSR